MPFLITDENKDLLSGLIPSEIVTCEEFLKWRQSHKDRNDRNKNIPGIKLDKDPVFARFEKQIIVNLLRDNTDPYFGILFACNWVSTDYTDLTAYICKATKIGKKFNITLDTVSDEKGKKANYKFYMVHYANRVRVLRKVPGTKDFGRKEMSGIYHLSSDIDSFIDKITTRYVRFCFLHDLKKTTVVIADDNFDLYSFKCDLSEGAEAGNLAEPALYDHGTGCCTITDN